MRIVDKYILKKVAAGYFFVLLIFIGLYLFIDISSTLSDFQQAKTPSRIIMDYFIAMTAFVYITVSPYALFISVLHSLAELNKNNEILNMRASGTSSLRVALPIIFFSLLVSLAAMFIQEKIVVHAQEKIETIKIKYVKKETNQSAQINNLAFSSGDTIIFARLFLPQEKTIQNAILFKEDTERQLTQKMVCQEIVYTKNAWEGRGVIEYDFDTKGNISDTPVYWAKKPVPLDDKPEDLVVKRGFFSQFASLYQLRKEIKRLKRLKAYDLLNELTLDFHWKLTAPLAHFFLVIGVLPIAMQIKKRKVTLSSLGIGFIIGMIYYSTNSFCIAIGKNGYILPAFAAWLAPLFFLTMGITGLLLER